jgi:hypothetical protein
VQLLVVVAGRPHLDSRELAHTFFELLHLIVVRHLQHDRPHRFGEASRNNLQFFVERGVVVVVRELCVETCQKVSLLLGIECIEYEHVFKGGLVN